MKAIFTTLAIAFGVWLIVKQPAALGQVASTPIPTSQLSRDMSRFPNFFQQGLEHREKEIRHLLDRQEAATEPPLQNNVNPQTELDRLPQIQPNNFPIPPQGQTQ
jgi:ABC-type bacteriocin/lantibiotic exporter with double-glycine peptidase domain